VRRIVLGLMGAVVGTALLIGLKAQGSAFDGTVAATGPQDPAGDPSGGAGSTAGPGGQPARGAPTAPGTTSGPGGAGPSAQPTGTMTTPPATTTTTQSRTITGTAVAARTARSPDCGDCSGNMQVRIVVTGRHIDSISTIQQSNRPLNTAAKLTPLALSAQSANVGNVSGATYSAAAWEQSLQSAINQI
jgi:uncharacterized protein with FMN-binding domain